jgi:phosphohistidine phosphatase
MEIFLVQHGQATAASDDPLRPLTPEGAESVRRIAAWARDRSLGVREIRHSGKLRAAQTAQILAEHLQPPGGVTGVSGLSPNDDVVPVARTAAGELANVMLVGHLPFLGRLAGFLVARSAEIQVVRFRNAGIVCLLEEQGIWSVKWAMPPDLVARAPGAGRAG